MPFTREQIRKLAQESDITLPKELIDVLIAEHTAARDAYAEEQVNAERGKHTPEDIKKTPEYKALEKQFNDYKAETESKATREAKDKAFREVLKTAGVADKYIDTIMRVTDLNGVELTTDGKVKDADTRVTAIKTEWADFVTTTKEKGTDTPKPPENNGSGNGVTKESIMAIKDGAARRQAMAQNMHLFGLAKESEQS